MKLSCLFKQHRRSASRAWVDGPVCRSMCKDCGTPLVRVASRRWIETRARPGFAFN